jgi:hypothetical protein
MTTVTIPQDIAIDAMFDARESRQRIEKTFEAEPTIRLKWTDEIDRRIRVLEEAVGFELQSRGTGFRHRALVPVAYYHQLSASAPAAATRSRGRIFSDWYREMRAIGFLRDHLSSVSLSDPDNEACRQLRRHERHARKYRREYERALPEVTDVAPREPARLS